jgi:small basic protein
MTFANRSWPWVIGVSALWVAVAAAATAYLIYRNNEAVVVLTIVGNLCLSPAASLWHRCARVGLVVAAMEVVVYGIWIFATLAGVSPR